MAAAGLVRGQQMTSATSRRTRFEMRRYFVNYVNSAGVSDRPETSRSRCRGKDREEEKKAIVKWIDQWTKEVQRLTGLPNKRNGDYTGSWWWGPKTGNSTKFARRATDSGLPVTAKHRRSGDGSGRGGSTRIAPRFLESGGTDANVWRGSNASLRKAAGLPASP